MSNKRMSLSAEGKLILDEVVNVLEVDRPHAIKIALAKGIATGTNLSLEPISGGTKWTIPDNIIKDYEFTLFKHLIIEEAKKPLNDEELHQYMLAYIENGLRTIKSMQSEKTSMEDARLMIL